MLWVVWFIWAPVGFFLWVPLLMRTTLLFAGLVIHSAITGQNPSVLRSHLEAAIDFWFAGFRIARNTVFQSLKTSPIPIQKQTSRVALEIFWASCFWFFSLWLFYPSVLFRFRIFVTKDFAATSEVWALVGVAIALAAFILGWFLAEARAKGRY